MKKRVISAIIMIAVFLLSVFLSPVTRLLIFLLLGVLCVREFGVQIAKMDISCPWVLPAAFLGVEAVLTFAEAKLEAHVIALVGFVLLIMIVGVIHEKTGAKGAIAAMFSLMYPSMLFSVIFAIGNSSLWLNTLALGCLSVWLCDSFALFGGMLFGKHKLAPHVSPNKTWEGTFCGAAFSMLAGVLVYFLGQWCQTVPYLGTLYQPTMALWKCMIIALCASSMGQLGDLAESLIKRMIGVKDFSNLIPGHGGAFDRVDSLLFALPTTYFLLHIL